MFQALGENGFYIHAVFNIVAIVIVYCFYPETSCRTLEEIDLLFASKTPFVWETEKKFQELKLQHSELVHGGPHLAKAVHSGIEEVETLPKENKM
ncbi:hypothetical protein H2200_000110 [Cladophialophora chaetospira]|uniref:Uncharacterized protein n=1 Tax=Cladophialophora chaetospira TaxID=386627 RepID=A0AA39CQ05_9EURO|nr:hypothetical protein H2200_000110 [Cladophialophora chaetospira]